MAESRPSLLRLLALASPLILFGALAGVFLFQLMTNKNASELPSALIGKPVPQFDLPALDGLKTKGVAIPGLKSTDLTGEIFLVNIFASWCAPCRAEHPALMKLAENDELRIVGINYKDQGENARRFFGGTWQPLFKCRR